MQNLSLTDNVTYRLSELKHPVITRYQLGQLIFQAVQDQPTLNVDTTAYLECESALAQRGILKSIPNTPTHSAYTLLGTALLDPRVLACGLDPFCYVSHLSAMEFHGLTDRMPEILYLSTPAPTQWRAYGLERMQHDLGDNLSTYMTAGFPPLQNIRFAKVLGKPVQRTSSLHLGAFRTYTEQHLRVSSLGRTFLDMLRTPERCGGIMHVIECYHEHAKPYLRLILDEIDQHGSPIDKVRAGFILEVLCGTTHERINHWKAFAKRGGSRKLDGSLDYSENFSEAWCLSINVPGIHVPTE